MSSAERRRTAWAGGDGRIARVAIFLVAPVLMLPWVRDFALARWLLVALALAAVCVFESRVAAAMAGRVRELWPLLGLSALVAGHLLAGAAVAESARWLVLVGVGGVAYLFCRVQDDAGRHESLRLLGLAGAAVGAYALVQVAGLDPIHYSTESWMYRVVTTFGHRNFSASFLMVAVLCGLGARGGGRDAHRPVLPAWALVLAYLGLLATGSRVPIAVATLALLVFFGRRRRSAVVLTVVVAAGVWLAVVVARGELRRVVTRTETIEIRRGLYRAELPLAIESPVLGLGAGAFSRRIPEALALRGASRRPDTVFLHAHNLPAELAIELGGVGLLLMVIFLAPAYRRAFAGGPGRVAPEAWAHLALVAVNLYDVSFFTYAGWVGFWPLVGLMRRSSGATPRPEAVAPAAVAALRVTVAVAMAAAAAVLLPMIASSRLCHAGAVALEEGRGGAAVELYRCAAARFPLPLDERYRAAVASLQAGRPAEAAVRLDAVEHEAPGFSAVRYNRAMAAAELGRYREAFEWIERHRELYPDDPDAAAAAVRLERRLAAEPADADPQPVP